MTAAHLHALHTAVLEFPAASPSPAAAQGSGAIAHSVRETLGVYLLRAPPWLLTISNAHLDVLQGTMLQQQPQQLLSCLTGHMVDALQVPRRAEKWHLQDLRGLFLGSARLDQGKQVCCCAF